MFCKNCGRALTEGEKFCAECGTKAEAPVNAVSNTQQNNFDNFNSQTDNYVTPEAQGDFYNQQPVNQNPPIYSYNETKPAKGGVLPFILGIISFVTSFLFFVSIPTGLVGLITGLKTKIKNGLCKAGIAFSIVGLSLTVAFIVIWVFAFIFPSGGTFYGDGFNLEYDGDWSQTTLEGGQEALKYENKSAFLVPIGVSALSDSTSDFDTSSGKQELYDGFYDYWNNDSSQSDTFQIYSGSDGFSQLTYDICYATYDYGISSGDIKGKYILLVSEEKNAVLSFMTNAAEDVEENDMRAIELLKSIEIYDQESSSVVENEKDESDYEVIYDEDMYEYLDDMRNWNMYSDLREGDLGKINDINGGWRVLSESETYWEFKDGEFWWYKSVNDLDDNYWYGTTEVLTGKDGLNEAGLDESSVDEIVSKSSGNVTEDDIYTVVCTPTKIISGGVDKSSTNIPKDTTWTYVWILVDHGDEGIEAQVLNTGTYETSYYVKIAD